MALIETWFNQDLKEPVKVRYLDGNVFSADNAGNLIGVNVFSDGEPASLGGSVAANVIRADGATVAVAGALSGNMATVVLNQSCYAVPGPISIIIKITAGGAVTTVCAVVANVYQSSTDIVVDPGTIIPSIEALIAEIEAAIASIPADYSSLWATLAPAYSNYSTYAVGQYVTYNGGLYRCITKITSGESWTAAHWTNVTLGQDISDIRNTMNYRSLHVLNDYFRPITTFIHYFDIFGDLTDWSAMPDFVLTQIGYYDSENRFYVVIRNNNKNVAFYKDYTSKPTSGIEWLKLPGETTDTHKKFECHILIDWGKYDEYRSTGAYTLPVQILDYSVFNSNVFYGNGTDLRIIPKNVIISGTFTLSNAYIMQEGEVLQGQNCTVTVTSTGQLSLANNCSVNNIHFVGDWEPTRTTEGDHYAPIISSSDLANGNSDAIWGTGIDSDYAVIHGSSSASQNASINKCRFSNFNRACITVIGGSHRNSGGYLIGENLFEDCRNAITVRSEFTKIYSNTFFRCIVGVVVMAGNLNKHGEIFKGCDCGIYYPANVVNGAHGEGVGMEIAHCGIAGLYSAEITYVGDFYTGCHFVDAPIIADLSNYLMITAGKLDTYVKIDSGANNAIMGNMVSVDYIGTHPLYDVPAGTYIKNNVPMRNATDAQVNNETN